MLLTTAVYSSGPVTPLMHEALAALTGEAAEIEPEAGGLDEHLGAVAVQEVAVAGGVDVFAQRVHDVGVDVILRGAGGVVGRCLVAVDGAPGEAGAGMAELARPGPGLGQLVVAVLEDAPRHARVGVDEERQDVDLGIPEIVALIGLAGEAAGTDAVALGAARGLQQLEQVPADDLLLLRRPAAFHLDVGVLPERPDIGLLPLAHAIEAVLQGTVQGPGRLRADFLAASSGRRGDS